MLDPPFWIWEPEYPLQTVQDQRGLLLWHSSWPSGLLEILTYYYASLIDIALMCVTINRRLIDLHRREFSREEKLWNEVWYLMRIRHQILVQLVGHCTESSWEAVYLQGSRPSFIFAEIPASLLCFEHGCDRRLDKYISDDETSDKKWNMRYEVIGGICAGLKCIHDECLIVHLDLKPENILLDATMLWCRRLQILVCQGSLVASNPEASLKIVLEHRDI